MTVVVSHTKLGTEFQGLEDNRFGDTVQHFRGVQYGNIGARFAIPELVHHYDATTGATEFGPVCPQPKVDIGHLLRLPPETEHPALTEDEFQCLNLNISRPVPDSSSTLIPVVVWIHGTLGGSQVVTFASAATTVCDPTHLVADSIRHAHPILIVTFNYRLNIFAFGDGRGAVNLAVKDQTLLLQWVKLYINEFGGDPNNITLAGESAGAVYAHAQIVLGAPVTRVALASGSLYLSRPLPREVGNGLIKKLESALGPSGNLSTSSASTLVGAVTQCKINSMWIQEEDRLKDWETARIEIPILIGDVEFESIIWGHGVEAMDSKEIDGCFEGAGIHASRLKTLYRVDPARPAQTRHAALDFINDVRFALPVDDFCFPGPDTSKNRYRYIFDQPNPWQASSRAHHAVDLIYLFGGYAFDQDSAAETVGRCFRRAWVDFVCGNSPWDPQLTYAFGPHGESRPLSREEVSHRRRTRHFGVLRTVGFESFNPVFAALATGRISLLN